MAASSSASASADDRVFAVDHCDGILNVIAMNVERLRGVQSFPESGQFISIEAFNQEARSLRIRQSDIEDSDRITDLEKRIKSIADRHIAYFRERQDGSTGVPLRSSSAAPATESRRRARGGALPGSPLNTSTGESPASTPQPPQKRARPAPASTPVGHAGAPFRIEDDWPHDVRVFYPELGAANRTVYLAGEALNSVIDHLQIATLECAAADAPACEFETALRTATNGLLEELTSTDGEDYDSVVSDIRETLLSLAPLKRAIASARIAVKRAFDLYTLATQTGGASWLTAEQLVYREIFDAQKLKYDPLYKPLQTWDERVAAAITACRQSSALSKDGALLGPVAPFVSRSLNRRPAADASAQAPMGRPPSASPRWVINRGRLARKQLFGKASNPAQGAGKPTGKPKAKPGAPRQDAGAGRPAAGVAPP